MIIVKSWVRATSMNGVMNVSMYTLYVSLYVSIWRATFKAFCVDPNIHTCLKERERESNEHIIHNNKTKYKQTNTNKRRTTDIDSMRQYNVYIFIHIYFFLLIFGCCLVSNFHNRARCKWNKHKKRHHSKVFVVLLWKKREIRSNVKFHYFFSFSFFLYFNKIQIFQLCALYTGLNAWINEHKTKY